MHARVGQTGRHTWELIWRLAVSILFLTVEEYFVARTFFFCTKRSQANYYGIGIRNKLFQHFGRLFFPGTLKSVQYFINELWVNFREESSEIDRLCRLQVSTDGQLVHFRVFDRNWVNCTIQAACFVLFPQLRFF